jgi:hypothetical protein
MRLLPALGLPALGPVLPHAVGDLLALCRGHTPLAAPAAAWTRGRLGLRAGTPPAATATATAEEIRELGANRLFLSTKLLEARQRAKARQAPELILIQICHTSS